MRAVPLVRNIQFFGAFGCCSGGAMEGGYGQTGCFNAGQARVVCKVDAERRAL